MGGGVESTGHRETHEPIGHVGVFDDFWHQVESKVRQTVRAWAVRGKKTCDFREVMTKIEVDTKGNRQERGVLPKVSKAIEDRHYKTSQAEEGHRERGAPNFRDEAILCVSFSLFFFSLTPLIAGAKGHGLRTS